MKHTIIFLLLVLTLSSCATPKILQATGGSRSDAVIEMAYTLGVFEEPVIDWALTQQTAGEKCIAWGYADAQPFGGQIQVCQQYDAYGSCLQALVTVKYQCTGITE